MQGLRWRSAQRFDFEAFVLIEESAWKVPGFWHPSCSKSRDGRIKHA